MKNIATNLIVVLKAILANSIGFINEYRLTTKLIAVFLMTALLMPLIFLGDWQKASAQISTAASQSNLVAPISAPPQAFIFASSDSVSAKAFGIAANFNASVINSYGAIKSFVTAPVLPEGFETAKPVSPLYASVVSMGNYLGTFLGFSNPSSATTSPLTTQTASNNTEYDFDGDGKSDVARWKPSTGEWQIKSSNGGSLTTSTLGTSASVLAPGDFDGDLKTDLAVFNAGVWTIKPSGGAQYTISFGTSGDIPVTGDYNGDGRSDYAIYRPSTATYWIQLSSDLSYYNTAFGASGDIRVPGDYEGDGKTDLAVYRPSDGNWYIKQSSNNATVNPHWGVATDIPVPADYDGDGMTDLSVYRPSSGTWFIYKSSTGTFIQQIWGNYGDQPVPADYDGDGRAELSVWRPKTGVWFTYKSCNFDSTCGANPQYIYEILGINGDVPVEAAYLKKIGGLVQSYDLAKLRLSPKNATGGTDLYSQNFSWGTGLVGLPGRAGLDAGFGISYNSLVWLKDTTNNVMIFDPDQSNVTPGFKLGFPTIEPVYYDKNTLKFSYLMITPSGARVEFQQTAASNIYETVDSSYVQLKTQDEGGINNPQTNLSLTVTGTDGTQMKYEFKAGAYRCKEIKDRNGNYITINHDQYGLLRTVTDTLGRVITVNYDAEFYPTSITQNWNDGNGSGSSVTHTWASFAYTNQAISTNFASGLSVFGPDNGTNVKVLQKITYSDSSYTTFEYNTYGQVSKVNNHAADWHVLNYMKTNLETPAVNQTDCPRFTETRSWVENFNNNAEVVVNNSITENQTIPEAGGTGIKIEVSMVGHPNSAVSKTFVGSSGWMEGLPIVTEDFADNGSGVARQRWTQTAWTQDNTALSYILNPRVTETKVGDTANTKRTTIEYYPVSTGSPIALYGLPFRVRAYAADQTTVWKESTTEYNLDNAYTSRRIIGLPSKTESSGFDQGASMLKLVSKVTYNYDEGNLNDSNFEQNITSVIRHDNTNYSASFVTGRGNLTSTTRWNVDYPTSSSEAVSSSVKYNIAGAVVAQTDPMNRIVKISYADQFNDTDTSRNTYAYPTKLTDPANNYSQIKYRFDIGANVWAKSPAPAGNTSGKETIKEYDLLGRLLKDTLVNSGAYTRYEYPTNGIQSKVYSTIIDTDNDGADADDEILSESFVDGAGRVLKSRTIHPGSSGGFTASLTEYDILGRIRRSSVPTETDSNWYPAGDDYTRGFLWTYQKYDWKGRVVRIINTDGVDSSTLNDSDQLFSYDGCGCAGGQVTTIESELVARNDQSGNARRKQKIYADILGRTYKTEIMNWDGTTDYTTTVQTFNGRDQVIKTRQYAGSTGSSTYQDVTMSYDGHGRLKTRHYPVEDANTDTTWIYNTDDSVQQVIDPRGAITNFTYNDPRSLLTQISYDPPSNPPQNIVIPDTPNVSFTYDSLGNRTSMTDGTGTTDYTYDQLSRITSETKDFTGLNDDLTISYTYHLGGGLKSITDPFNSTVSYTNDKAGRVTAVSGTAWAQNTTGDYAENIKYRAFGQIKQLDYTLPDDTPQIKFQYDNRLRVNQHEITSTNSQNPTLMKSDFTYSSDSKITAKDDLVDNKWDQTIKYDFAGRMTFNQFGMGLGSDSSMKRVYEQAIGYDAFSMMTTRLGVYWDNDIEFTESYTKGRIDSDSSFHYDASGNIAYINDGYNPHTYSKVYFDASGKRIGIYNSLKGRDGGILNMVKEHLSEYEFDGDGRPVIEKLAAQQYHAVNDPVPPPLVSIPRTYQVWSTVLGSSLTTLNLNGDKVETKVFGGGAVIATQHRGVNFQQQVVESIAWTTTEPVTGSKGRFGYGWAGPGFSRIEAEPLGQEISTVDQTIPPGPPFPYEPDRLGQASEPQWQCQLAEAINGGFSGMPVHCQRAMWEDVSKSLDNLFGNTNAAERRIDNITRLVDSPLPYSNSASSSTLAFALSSTAKKSAFGDDDDDPESEKHRKQREFTVNVFDDSIPGFIDASQSNIDDEFLKLNTRNIAKAPNNETIDKCLKPLGAENLKVSYDESNRVFTTTVTLKGKSVTIKTRTGRASVAQLGLEYANAQNFKYDGGWQSGLTVLGSHLTNDIASDIGAGIGNLSFKPEAFKALYFHELANALASENYTNDFNNSKTDKEKAKLVSPFNRTTKPTNSGDRDAGVVFERCLYGGIVGLRSGRIGNSREL